MDKKLPIIIISLLITSCIEVEEPHHPTSISLEIEPIYVPTDTALLRQRHKLIEKELDYYLKRHKVDEEGYEMVVAYASRGTQILGDYLRPAQSHLIGMLPLRNIHRQGFGLADDGEGQLCLGSWQQDTLTIGIRIDSTGLYAGPFDRKMQASGHGCYSAFDASFYEGHWTDNKKEGFGIQVSPQNLLSGTWRNNRFFGEHMQHTSDRIYGIDISRYQHEKGKRRFGINWNELRITNLGKLIQGNISGEVDYPVRFVYIKSTQGTTIRNRYLISDYTAARKKKIPVGTYHFFSTKKKGREQAVYYVNNTLFKKGDLPPVLDVEPSEQQIKKYGGTSILIREMRAWIGYIEQRLKVKPILYVNQNFIFNHLSQAPDLLENYTIWIARYGEYKPGIHLALWQVSQDSRVKGIQTPVDVNVFNGFETQWQDFLQEETIFMTQP